MAENKNLTPFRRTFGLEPMFGDLQHMMNTLFEDFYRGNEGWGLMPRMTNAMAATPNFMPRLDVSEDERCVYVATEIPGMTEKDIELTLTGTTLTIKGEKKSEKKEEDTKRNWHRVERTWGQFLRQVELPCEVEHDKIEAMYKDGVLNVTLPKSRAAQQSAKKISVKTGN